MFISKPCQISPNVHFVGNQMMCNFIIKTNEKLVLLDAGLTISALLLKKQIAALETNSEKLQSIWLTHSHYDHIGSIPYLLKKFPVNEIGAHPVAKQTLENPRAIQLIKLLNSESEKRFAKQVTLPDEAKFQTFEINRLFTNGEYIDLDYDLSIQIIYTPGHTRDSIAFYILPDKVLYGGDGLGIPTPTGFIQAEFLSHYDDYLTSLYKLQKMDIEILALPHAGVFKGYEDVNDHFDKSIEETFSLRNRISNYLKKHNGDVESVTNKIADEDLEKHQIMQPKEAFMINLRAMVVRTKKDLFESK